MCPICLAIAGLPTTVFRPWARLRRSGRERNAWRLES